MRSFHATRPVVVIGAAVGDIVLGLARLPHSGEDLEAENRGSQIGGCAFNVARVLRRLEVPVINGMTVGNGVWGQQVEETMQTLEMTVLLRHSHMDNGWCLALVEPNGERTFISVPGCEGIWSDELLANVVPPANALIYASGYELVGEAGAPLRRWLLAHPQQKLIDLGPRLADIPADFIPALQGSDTLLTLNRDETRYLCGAGEPAAQAARYAEQWGLTLICHLDQDGAWICPPDGAPRHLAAYPATVADTIGAGDAHCGGLLAGLSAGWMLDGAVDLANRVAAFVVENTGAASAPDWVQLQRRFPVTHSAS
ncbi:PfkB family carbohydrate kinase [Musicola keenii]|uniref:PfkB family carbohydrate kinase n=1 Tax=Musicola keenii TaxID=2884250 RepID=UPI00177F2259|nr:PfkB family carbohydrate kinase [Musicola keenii]